MLDYNFYREIIEQSSLGYACYKIITNDDGLPVNYEFIEVNEMFEKLTGLKQDDIIHQKVTDVLPSLNDDGVDWVAFYGEVALSGVVKEFEKHSQPLNKYYHVKAYSPKKYYFVTIFSDISNQIYISNTVRQFIEDSSSEINYQKIIDDMRRLSGAKHAVLNLFDDDKKTYITTSTNQTDLTKVVDLLGFKIIGHEWDYNEMLAQRSSELPIAYFDSLHLLSGNTIPKSIIKLIETSFHLGQVIVLSIIKDSRIKGDFMLIMDKGKTLIHQEIVKIYAFQVGLFLDKKKNEAALRKSQIDYKDLAEQSHVGIITCNRDGQITYVNERFVDILGLPKDQLIKKLNLLTFSQLKKQGVCQHILDSMEEDRIITCEFFYRSKRRNTIWFKAHIKPNKINNTIIGARIIIDDITESKLTKERLASSEQNFRTFFETIDDMIFVSDQQGKIYYANNAVIKTLGYSQEELKQMHLLQLHPMHLQNEATDIFTQMFEGKLSACPLPLQAKNGVFVPVETRIWFGQWDEKECIFGICKNLTKEQEALQKFNKIFNNTTALMALSSLSNQKFTEVNDAFVLALGYSRHEIIGKTSAELNLFPEIEKQEKTKQELKNNGYIYNHQLKVRTKSGKLIDGLFSGEIIESQGQKYFLTTMMDITKLKESQAKIEYLSFHDQLTGLYNRHFFEETLQKYEASCYFPLSIIMIDVNGLKLVNDAFGHAVGDQLLKKVAKILKKECSDKDLIARIGGDEFIILSPDVTAEQTEALVKQIKLTVSQEQIKGINISVCLGWQTRQHEDKSLQELLKNAEEYMYKNKLNESASMRNKSVSVMMKTLYEKNEREKKHSERVSQLCFGLSHALNLSNEKKNDMLIAGLMHDIGKIVIDTSILDKEGSLTDKEWSEIRRHPEAGYQILRSVDEYASIAQYVLAHHEKWDGTGYPKGLKGEAIPFEARIISIADTYDAMTNDRPYRKGLSKDVAIREIEKHAGTQFDPNIVNVFVKYIEKILAITE